MKHLHLTLIVMTLGCTYLFSAPAVDAQACADCNVDGQIDFLDGFAVSEHAVGTTPITGSRILACDVDGSGWIDFVDRLIIDMGHPTACRDCLDCGGPNGRPDGRVDVWDFDAAQQAYYRGTPLDSVLQACDADGSGDITPADLMEIQNRVQFGSPEPSCIACSDCNADGVLNALDAEAAADHAVGLIVLTGRAFEACDVDDDGDVDVIDAFKIRAAEGGPPLTSCVF